MAKSRTIAVFGPDFNEFSGDSRQSWGVPVTPGLWTNRNRWDKRATAGWHFRCDSERPESSVPEGGWVDGIVGHLAVDGLAIDIHQSRNLIDISFVQSQHPQEVFFFRIADDG